MFSGLNEDDLRFLLGVLVKSYLYWQFGLQRVELCPEYSTVSTLLESLIVDQVSPIVDQLLPQFGCGFQRSAEIDLGVVRCVYFVILNFLTDLL